MSSEFRLHLVLDNIRSVFNVGSIFRTADAVGNSKMYLCGMTATPENIKIKKTALGATDSVPFEYFEHTIEAIMQLKALNIPIVAVELTENAVNFQEFYYPNPVALVFGHERRGVDQRILDLCDACVIIPMQGIKESLNVSTSAGIIMYEAIRGKAKKLRSQKV